MTTIETTHFVIPAPRRQPLSHLSATVTAAGTGLLLVLSPSGCACRPGFIGPYGGYYPARCFVG